MKSFAGKKSAARHSDPLQPGHVVQFYTREQFMIDEVARRTARALRSRIPAVLVATENHLQNFEVRLGQLGLPVDRLRDRHLYVTFDASETLHTFMDGLLPDRERFDRVIGGLIKEAAGLSPTGLVSIFGEMVALLCAAAQRAILQARSCWKSSGTNSPADSVSHCAAHIRLSCSAPIQWAQYSAFANNIPCASPPRVRCNRPAKQKLSSISEPISVVNKMRTAARGGHAHS